VDAEPEHRYLSNKSRGLLGSTPASLSKYSGFKYRSGDRLYVPTFLLGFLSPPGKCRHSTSLGNGRCHILSSSLFINHRYVVSATNSVIKYINTFVLFRSTTFRSFSQLNCMFSSLQFVLKAACVMGLNILWEVSLSYMDFI
jgi:hypothetical protein